MDSVFWYLSGLRISFLNHDSVVVDKGTFELDLTKIEEF